MAGTQLGDGPGFCRLSVLWGLPSGQKEGPHGCASGVTAQGQGQDACTGRRAAASSSVLSLLPRRRRHWVLQLASPSPLLYFFKNL